MPWFRYDEPPDIDIDRGVDREQDPQQCGKRPTRSPHQRPAGIVAGRPALERAPRLNACWFAARTLEVRRKYGLTIDRAEADAVEGILPQCGSTDMVVVECGTAAVAPVTRPRTQEESGGDVDALVRGNRDIHPAGEGWVSPNARLRRGEGLMCRLALPESGRLP